MHVQFKIREDSLVAIIPKRNFKDIIYNFLTFAWKNIHAFGIWMQNLCLKSFIFSQKRFSPEDSTRVRWSMIGVFRNKCFHDNNNLFSFYLNTRRKKNLYSFHFSLSQALLIAALTSHRMEQIFG